MTKENPVWTASSPYRNPNDADVARKILLGFHSLSGQGLTWLISGEIGIDELPDGSTDRP